MHKSLRIVLAMGLAAALGAAAPAAEADWQELFDGKFPVNFRGYKMLNFPYNAWGVRAGSILTVAGNDRTDLIVRQSCTNFEFSVEYRLGAGAGGGIVYLVQEGSAKAAMAGLKMTLADDEKHAEAKANPLCRSGSLGGILPAPNARPRPPGQWNEAKIVVRGRQVEHWINGDKVLAYELQSEVFESAVKRNRVRNLPDFSEITEGYIALEHPGVEAAFRNPKLKILVAEAPSEPEPVTEGKPPATNATNRIEPGE